MFNKNYQSPAHKIIYFSNPLSAIFKALNKEEQTQNRNLKYVSEIDCR